jgi:AbiU2
MTESKPSPTKKRKRKVPVTIKRGEAVRRLGGMLKAIYRDALMVLAAEAALETANAIVVASPNAERPGPVTYETVTQSLMLNMAMSLARLYDLGSRRYPPNKRDLASIPLIVRLLKQKRCQDELARRARAWIPHMPSIADSQEKACRKAIADVLAAFTALRCDPTGRAAMARLRNMRDKLMAHSFMEEVRLAMPTYDQLFRLADVARDVAAGAMFAIDGQHVDLLDFEKERLKQGGLFWGHALRLPADSSQSASSAQMKRSFKPFR